MFAVFLLAMYFVLLVGYVAPQIIMYHGQIRDRVKASGLEVKVGLVDVKVKSRRGWLLTGNDWWLDENLDSQ